MGQRLVVVAASTWELTPQLYTVWAAAEPLVSTWGSDIKVLPANLWTCASLIPPAAVCDDVSTPLADGIKRANGVLMTASVFASSLSAFGLLRTTRLFAKELWTACCLCKESTTVIIWNIKASNRSCISRCTEILVWCKRWHGIVQHRRSDLLGTALKLLGWKVTAVTVPSHLRGSPYPKSKTLEGRMEGLSGHLSPTPQDPGKDAENPGSGLPPAQIQTGSWVIWEAHMRLSSQRSSFQGNVDLYPSR